MTAPLALRLTVHGHHLDAAGLLAEELPRGGDLAGLVLSRNDVLRLAIARGLEQLRDELGARDSTPTTEGGGHAAL